MAPIHKPKYQHIKEELYNDILSNHYKIGQQFYTEAELIDKYQVSSITVIRALKELENEGYLIRKQGLGTFIARTSQDRLVQFSYQNNPADVQEAIQVLSLNKGNHPFYLDQLGLHKTEYYYTLTRTRRLDNQPYIYQESYIPHDYILEANSAKEDAYHSLYHRFFEDFQIQMAEQPFCQRTDVIQPKPAARHFLALTCDQHCIRQLKTTKHRETGRVLEYAEVYKALDFFTYQIKSTDF
ncbi:GntR family transcriptional regulator [Streptococcus halichoeri]|uniref:GntR family transcriptional regulator n=1 Tax=Streptococcus halichoeri TaxID=254785 RepID=UPI001359AF41|nr:GntR family transcriptional regulator [Streptococcus halichoeri]